MIAYHDEEWGVPVHDDRVLFEFLILEGAQAGLSWSTILRKRDGYRRAYRGFDPAKVARFGERDVARLLADANIVRNAGKIAWSVRNAQAFLDVQREFGSFDAFLWAYVNGKPLVNRPREPGDVPAKTELSDRLSRDLRKRGFGFVGSTICYALLQAVGVVDDHAATCFRAHPAPGGRRARGVSARMMRPLAALQAVALLAAALVPAPSPAAAAPGDRVGTLVGNWTCRDPRGKLTRLAFSADGTALVAHETAPGAGAEVSPPQRYVPVKAGWLVTSVGESRTFSGSAPAWTGATWDIDGSAVAAPPAYAPQAVPERISYERVDANTIRRTVAYGPEHRVADGEVCTRGDEPPASSLCAAHDVPPRMVRAVEPDTPPLAQQQGILGTVRVRVSLDAGGQPVAVRIEQSPSAILNSSAISAARRSTYEPALRDCVPVPSDYLFSVSFSSR